MVVIGDAPAKVVGGAEPVSGLTASQLVAQSIALDPVAVTGANVGGGGLDIGGHLTEIAGGTGGRVILGSDVVATISEVIETAAGSPFAWLGVAYSGKVGEAILFDASGSYDSAGIGLSKYEWSFFGDGTYNRVTTVPETSYTYGTVFTGTVLVRVTSTAGKTALGSASIIVNVAGFASQGDEEPCEVDSDGNPIVADEGGNALPCTPDLPDKDKEGVEEIVDASGDKKCPFNVFLLDVFLCFIYGIISWIVSFFS
jgi:hypothetical protein